MKLGALDIGTNSIHIVLARIGAGLSFEVIGREKDMTRLGDQTFKSGWIPKDKFDRAVRVVNQFVRLAHHRGVNRIIGMATSAVREASNGGELIDRIAREAGVKVRTITGEEEARLIYLAVRNAVDLSRRKGLIVDVGGGSVELIVGDQAEAGFMRCLKLGSARLSDLFLSDDPVSKREHERLHEHLSESLESTLEEIRPMRPELMIGTSGTILNIANVIHHRRTGEPMTQVIGFSVTEEEIRELHRDLGRYSDGDRERIPGIDPERRDTLLPGTCLLLHLMDELDLKELTLCDRAIREGMILDFIQRNSKRIEQEQEIPNVRRRSVMTLAERCEYEEGHARHTADLSLKLFRAMGLGRALFPNAEEILEYGALLHDIGYHVSYKKHHKHAYYLIKHADLAGFSPEEVDVIACIARYHRKKAPKRGDAALSTLSNRGIRTVRALSAVVRVADALDRSHFGLIRNLKVQKNGSSLRIRVQAAGDPAIELWAADQRKKLLERICGLTVEFVGLPAALQK